MRPFLVSLPLVAPTAGKLMRQEDGSYVEQHPQLGGHAFIEELAELQQKSRKNSRLSDSSERWTEEPGNFKETAKSYPFTERKVAPEEQPAIPPEQHVFVDSKGDIQPIVAAKKKSPAAGAAPVNAFNAPSTRDTFSKGVVASSAGKAAQSPFPDAAAAANDAAAGTVKTLQKHWS